MKYKIIEESVVKNIIEFLDEIQFESTNSSDPTDIHRINFCNWVISELMNSTDGYDSEDEMEDGNSSTEEEIKNRYKDIERYRESLRKDFPEDMTEEDWRKLINTFDAFVEGFNKESKKTEHKKNAKNCDLKEFESQLRMDRELSPHEKFELYYDERKKQKGDIEEEGISYKKMLNDLGIEPSSKK